MRNSPEEALATQMEVFDDGHHADLGQLEMPGGIDINSHLDLFSAVFGKVGRDRRITDGEITLFSLAPLTSVPFPHFSSLSLFSSSVFLSPFFHLPPSFSLFALSLLPPSLSPFFRFAVLLILSHFYTSFKIFS